MEAPQRQREQQLALYERLDRRVHAREDEDFARPRFRAEAGGGIGDSSDSLPTSCARRWRARGASDPPWKCHRDGTTGVTKARARRQVPWKSRKELEPGARVELATY